MPLRWLIVAQPIVLGRRLPPLYVAAAVMALAIANAYYATWSIIEGLAFGGQTDWRAHTEAGSRILHGVNPYTEYGGYFGLRWSPLISYGFGLLAWLPFWAWAALHVVAAMGFRDWRVSALVLVSWPFILDTIDGGIMTFVALAAWWAYRATRLGTAAFFAFVLLVPRPMMLPLLGWLLWSRPAWRLPFLAMAVVHGFAVVASGWGDEWVSRLLSSGVGPIIDPVNISPSRFIGSSWVPLGLLLAAILTWKRRLGWASLAASPYVLPPYLLMLLLEVKRSGGGAPPDRRSDPAQQGQLPGT